MTTRLSFNTSSLLSSPNRFYPSVFKKTTSLTFFVIFVDVLPVHQDRLNINFNKTVADFLRVSHYIVQLAHDFLVRLLEYQHCEQEETKSFIKRPREIGSRILTQIDRRLGNHEGQPEPQNQPYQPRHPGWTKNLRDKRAAETQCGRQKGCGSVFPSTRARLRNEGTWIFHDSLPVKIRDPFTSESPYL